MSHRHDPHDKLLYAKLALLGADRLARGNSSSPPIVENASSVIRKHPVACLAGTAAAGVLLASQPWARRLLISATRKAATTAVAYALAK